MIREMAPSTGVKSVKLSDVQEIVTSKGFRPDLLQQCIEEYEELNVWQVNTARTRLTFI